jgi:membrane-bound serine protease (ClpP class)
MNREHTILRPLLLFMLVFALLGQAVPDAPSVESVDGPILRDPLAPVTPANKAATQTVTPGGANVAVIKIEGMIYGFTLESLQRRVERAMEGNASMIVIELDTPGGEVMAALNIAKYIKGEITVPTIAWINNSAYSAGILIASSCNRIIMSPASTTGDCAPIIPGQELAPTERAKALSPLLEEFRDNARANNKDYALYHAMCVLGVEVYLIENKSTGKQKLVNQIDKALMVDGKLSDSNVINKNFGKDKQTGDPILDDVASVSRDVALDEDFGQWKLIKQIHDGKTLLTLNQSRAVEVGLAETDTIKNEADLKKYLNANIVAPVTQSWSENMAGWLTHPAVRAVLVLALLIGGYAEFQTPGLGLPGAVAATALVLLIGAPFLIGLAEVWHIILILVGIVLLFVELVITPGFGLPGITGIVFILTGLTLAIIPTTGNGPLPLPAPEMYGRLQVAAMWMLLSLIFGVGGMMAMTRYYGNIPGLNRLILKEPSEEEKRAVHYHAQNVGTQAKLTVGLVGIAATALRPSGQAKLDDQFVDVVSNGSFIDKGTEIKIIEIHGNQVVVEEA